MARILNAEEWGDVADLIEQFQGQCEQAYEEHEPAAKDKLHNWLENLKTKATSNMLLAKKAGRVGERTEHPPHNYTGIF